MRFLLGSAPRLRHRLFFLLTAPIRLGESGAPSAFFVGLARIMYGPDSTRLFFRR